MQLDPIYLPDIPVLRRRAQALAMLDAIVCPEWDSRYYSFNARWSASESVGSMRNGSGDDWFILFGVFGAAIKGLAHETELARDKLLSSEVQSKVPQTFASFLDEPAFGMNYLSYCYWRDSKEATWHKVEHPVSAVSKLEDGSSEYLALLIEPADAYEEFTKWYYELDIPLASIEWIYNHGPLTESIVHSLNPEVTLAQAQESASEIGYPIDCADA